MCALLVVLVFSVIIVVFDLICLPFLLLDTTSKGGTGNAVVDVVVVEDDSVGTAVAEGSDGDGASEVEVKSQPNAKSTSKLNVIKNE